MVAPRKPQFARALRGYDRQQVDDYAATLCSRLEELTTRLVDQGRLPTVALPALPARPALPGEPGVPVRSAQQTRPDAPGEVAMGPAGPLAGVEQWVVGALLGPFAGSPPAAEPPVEDWVRRDPPVPAAGAASSADRSDRAVASDLRPAKRDVRSPR